MEMDTKAWKDKSGGCHWGTEQEIIFLKWPVIDWGMELGGKMYDPEDHLVLQPSNK